MLTREELNDCIEKIQEYAAYEDTEAGEYWEYLTDIGNRLDCMSLGFKKAYEKEVVETLKFIQENYRLVEQEYVPKVDPIKIKVLEWIGYEN